MFKKSVITLFACLIATPVLGAFQAELADETEDGAVYFVSYQRGQIVRGTVWDTENKVKKKLVKKSHEFCLKSGYRYLRFPTLGQIAKDEDLSAIWELAMGGEQMDSSEIEGGDSTLTAHKSHRLLQLSTKPLEGYEECRVQ